MILSEEFIEIDVIFDDNEFAEVSAATISKITINFNKDKLIFAITILKIMINFDKNKPVFAITISKKNNVNNFD